jgi:hypothetical protein
VRYCVQKNQKEIWDARRKSIQAHVNYAVIDRTFVADVHSIFPLTVKALDRVRQDLQSPQCRASSLTDERNI